MVAGCQRAHRAKGYCSGHYQQIQRGLPITPIRSRATDSDYASSFWDRVTKTDACWLWEGKKTTLGYGQLKRNGKTIAAHRYSWELVVGPIPERAYIDHRCHNPSCVNPEHLRPVTPKQNMENRSSANVNSSSGVLGVHWNSNKKKWRVRVSMGGEQIHIGWFKSVSEAEDAALAARLAYYTHSDGR